MVWLSYLLQKLFEDFMVTRNMERITFFSNILTTFFCLAIFPEAWSWNSLVVISTSALRRILLLCPRLENALFPFQYQDTDVVSYNIELPQIKFIYTVALPERYYCMDHLFSHRHVWVPLNATTFGKVKSQSHSRSRRNSQRNLKMKPLLSFQKASSVRQAWITTLGNTSASGA